MNTCKQCKWFRIAQGKMGHCYLKPPVVFMIPIAVDNPKMVGGKIIQGEQQVSMNPISTYPLVQESATCSEHQPLLPH